MGASLDQKHSHFSFRFQITINIYKLYYGIRVVTYNCKFCLCRQSSITKFTNVEIKERKTKWNKNLY